MSQENVEIVLAMYEPFARGGLQRLGRSPCRRLRVFVASPELA